MNGVRVYTNPENPETSDAIFYSRREDGPYYRWSYEEKQRQWRVARVSSSGFSPRVLCTISWKIVPPALRRRMVDHYEE